MPRIQTVLAIDDTAENLGLLESLLEGESYRVLVATSGERGLEIARTQKPDIILLDIMMPGWDGFETAQRIKQFDRLNKTPILFLSALDDTPSKVKAFEAGGVDYITKPFQRPELVARIANHLELSELRENLQQQVTEKTKALKQSQESALNLLSLASEYRDYETGMHNNRLGVYAHFITGQLGWNRRERDLILHAAPLHDLGKIGIPDDILHKPGRFEPHELRVMMTHTSIGAKILRSVADQNPLLQMAADIAEGHHETYDGTGYPFKTAGEAIPMAARITSLCDVYDALRSERPYKQPFDHEKALRIILEGDRRTRPEHFDPDVLGIFRRHHYQLDRIFGMLTAPSNLTLPQLVEQVDS
jgi:putative two-component system response regulator